MNTSNKILVTVLAFVLVCITGYAIFSEKIEVNGTATATGTFNIEGTCTLGIDDAYFDKGKYTSTNQNQGGYEADFCFVSTDTVSFKTNLLYPTAVRAFTVKFTNTGTIPALLWGATETTQLESFDFLPNSKYFIKDAITNEVAYEENTVLINGNSFLEGWGTMVVSSDGQVNADKNIIYDKQKGYAGVKLDTGDSIYAIIALRYPQNANAFLPNSGKDHYFEFKINHPFKWEQYTDNPNFESTTFDEWCITGC